MFLVCNYINVDTVPADLWPGLEGSRHAILSFLKYQLHCTPNDFSMWCPLELYYSKKPTTQPNYLVSNSTHHQFMFQN